MRPDPAPDLSIVPNADPGDRARPYTSPAHRLLCIASVTNAAFSQAPRMHPAAALHESVVLFTGFPSWRGLRARRDELGLTLRPDEDERLAELERVFGRPVSTLALGEIEGLFLSRLHERH